MQYLELKIYQLLATLLEGDLALLIVQMIHDWNKSYKPHKEILKYLKLSTNLISSYSDKPGRCFSIRGWPNIGKGQYGYEIFLTKSLFYRGGQCHHVLVLDISKGKPSHVHRLLNSIKESIFYENFLVYQNSSGGRMTLAFSLESDQDYPDRIIECEALFRGWTKKKMGYCRGKYFHAYDNETVGLPLGTRKCKGIWLF